MPARAPASIHEPADLAPAAAFFRDPALAHLRLSPDGSQVAGVATRGGVRWIVVRAARGGEVRFLAKLDEPGQEIRTLGWASDERILAGVEMPSPIARGVRARQSRLFVVPLDGSRARYLARSWPHHAYSQWQDQVLSWLWDDPDHVLINWWQRDRDLGSVRQSITSARQTGASARLVDVRTGRLRPLVRFVPFVTQWAADHLGQVRAGWGRTPSDGRSFLLARASPDDPFERVIEFGPDNASGFAFGAFSEHPTKLYVISDRDGGRDAVYAYDLVSKQLGERIFGHPEVDVDTLYSSARDGRLLAIGYAIDRPRLHFVDDGARHEQAALDHRFPGTTNRIVSRDRDELSALVEVSGDTVPPRIYHWRRGGRRIELLVDTHPEVEPRWLSPMEPISFPARDGLEIRGYLTLPRGAASKRLPVVVVVHGGPHSRAVWGWDSTVQFLASRGFAVLQPNFRGSSGYGREHAARGDGQWGLAMQDDLEDAARWLIDRGVADPARIGIYGVGYGGYAALMALAKAPELFAAGASCAGVTNLFALLDEEAWGGADARIVRRVGDRWSDRERLRETSPIENADRIRAPVLLAHGTADDAVHVRHSERMAATLASRGKDVEILLYPGEGHGFIHESNRIDFHERLAGFFARHLARKSPVAASDQANGQTPTLGGSSSDRRRFPHEAGRGARGLGLLRRTPALL